MKLASINISIHCFLLLLSALILSSCGIDGKFEQNDVHTSFDKTESDNKPLSSHSIDEKPERDVANITLNETAREVNITSAESRDSNPKLDYINSCIKYLGRTAEDIVMNTNYIVRSKWSDQDSETLALYDDWYYQYFSV